jgi:hypothetical protein
LCFPRLVWYMGSSIYLQRSGIEDLRDFIVAAAAVELFMILFFLECKVYDLATALLFAASLGLLARGKLTAYFVLFPFACLNRETSFLLTAVFAVYFYSRLSFRDWSIGVGCKVLAFVIIRLCLMFAFANNAGVPFLFRLQENIADHLQYPGRSLLFLAGVLITVWLCARHWHAKPLLLQTAFLVLAPALMVMYLLFGWAFELRVFAELYPLAVVLATWSWYS